MKASDKPQLSKKWWVSNRPQEIKGADLEKALANAEKALADEKKKSTPQSIDGCLSALKAVATAVTKTLKECDKKKHKDVISVLKKYDALIKSESAALEKKRTADAKGSAAGGEDDEDVSDDKLFEKDYLYKMMKLMKSAGKELRFGFGLNTNAPEASRLLLKRKGKPELLFKTLKKTKEFSNRLLTYGYAKSDPDDGQTLIFRLEAGANEPPRILKLGRKFLRADKKLRFRKLKLVLPSGKTIEDNEPDADDIAEAAGAGDGADLKAAQAAAQNFVRLWDNTLRDVSKQVDGLRKAIADFDDDGMKDVHDRLGTVLDRFPDLDLTKLVAAAKANDNVAYAQTLRQTAKEVDEVQKLLKKGPLLSTIDENPFVKTTVHATVNKVLTEIVAQLGV